MYLYGYAYSRYLNTYLFKSSFSTNVFQALKFDEKNIFFEGTYPQPIGSYLTFTKRSRKSPLKVCSLQFEFVTFLSENIEKFRTEHFFSTRWIYFTRQNGWSYCRNVQLSIVYVYVSESQWFVLQEYKTSI